MPVKKRVRRRRRQQKHVSLKHALQKLTRMKGKARKNELQQANNVFIRQVSSAVKGLRTKPLSSKRRSKLTHHRTALRALANPQSSLKSKRNVLVRQKGGFFSALASVLGK